MSVGNAAACVEIATLWHLFTHSTRRKKTISKPADTRLVVGHFVDYGDRESDHGPWSDAVSDAPGLVTQRPCDVDVVVVDAVTLRQRHK